MSDFWATHYEGEIEGRSIKVETYPRGGDRSYRVRSTQAKDHEGTVSSDESSIMIVPPTSAGRPIDLEGQTIDEVVEQLKKEEFSNEAMNKIVSYFPA